MNDILTKSIVPVLNRNWLAINSRTPQDAFCQMATNVDRTATRSARVSNHGQNSSPCVD